MEKNTKLHIQMNAIKWHFLQICRTQSTTLKYTVERQVLTHLRLVLTPPEFLPISHRGA